MEYIPTLEEFGQGVRKEENSFDVPAEDILRHLGRVTELVVENRRLQENLEHKESIVKGYNLKLRDMQDQLLNHKGALKRQGDEIHVLYHKISTLLGDNKPKGYCNFRDKDKREALHEVLDTVEPTEINFTYGEGKYTLSEYGIEPGVDPVSHYPDEKLYLC